MSLWDEQLSRISTMDAHNSTDSPSLKKRKVVDLYETDIPIIKSNIVLENKNELINSESEERKSEDETDAEVQTYTVAPLDSKQLIRELVTCPEIDPNVKLAIKNLEDGMTGEKIESIEKKYGLRISEKYNLLSNENSKMDFFNILQAADKETELLETLLFFSNETFMYGLKTLTTTITALSSIPNPKEFMKSRIEASKEARKQEVFKERLKNYLNRDKLEKKSLAVVIITSLLLKC